MLNMIPLATININISKREVDQAKTLRGTSLHQQLERKQDEVLVLHDSHKSLVASQIMQILPVDIRALAHRF